MAGIFADEAITGTKIDKCEGFQEMIRKRSVYYIINGSSESNLRIDRSWSVK